MELNKHMKTTMSLAAAMGTLALATSAQAATTIVGAADFTLSSSSAAGATHDNLPAAFLAQLAPGVITPSATSTHGSFPVSNLTDGDLGTGSGTSSWASGSASTVTLTLDFASADVAGIILNWGWGDRTLGDYKVKINGTSLGSIQVDTAGGTTGAESSELNTYIIFDSVQSGATKIEVIGTNGDGNANAWGFDEIEVYTGVVPEPSTTALLGLGGLALILRRRK
jgi:hypothetical protein